MVVLSWLFAGISGWLWLWLVVENVVVRVVSVVVTAVAGYTCPYITLHRLDVGSVCVDSGGLHQCCPLQTESESKLASLSLAKTG